MTLTTQFFISQSCIPALQNHDLETCYILQLSDTHLFDPHLLDTNQLLYGVDTNQRLINLISQLKPLLSQHQITLEAVLVTGDLVQQGGLPALNQLYEQVARLSPMWQLWLPGNHDELALLKIFQAQQKQPVNAKLKIAPFTHGNDQWQIIGLSTKQSQSTAGLLDAENLNYLTTALQQDKTHLIALHHPPLNVGSRWIDRQQLQNSQMLWPILAETNNRIIITHGHTHQYHQTEFHPPKPNLTGLNLTKLNQSRRPQKEGHNITVVGCPATSLEFTPLSDEFKINPHRYGALLWKIETAKMPKKEMNSNQKGSNLVKINWYPLECEE